MTDYSQIDWGRCLYLPLVAERHNLPNGTTLEVGFDPKMQAPALYVVKRELAMFRGESGTWRLPDNAPSMDPDILIDAAGSVERFLEHEAIEPTEKDKENHSKAMAWLKSHPGEVLTGVDRKSYFLLSFMWSPLLGILACSFPLKPKGTLIRQASLPLNMEWCWEANQQ